MVYHVYVAYEKDDSPHTHSPTVNCRDGGNTWHIYIISDTYPEDELFWYVKKLVA